MAMTIGEQWLWKEKDKRRRGKGERKEESWRWVVGKEKILQLGGVRAGIVDIEGGEKLLLAVLIIVYCPKGRYSLGISKRAVLLIYSASGARAFGWCSRCTVCCVMYVNTYNRLKSVDIQQSQTLFVIVVFVVNVMVVGSPLSVGPLGCPQSHDHLSSILIHSSWFQSSVVLISIVYYCLLFFFFFFGHPFQRSIHMCIVIWWITIPTSNRTVTIDKISSLFCGFGLVFFIITMYEHA